MSACMGEGVSAKLVRWLWTGVPRCIYLVDVCGAPGGVFVCAHACIYQSDQSNAHLGLGKRRDGRDRKEAASIRHTPPFPHLHHHLPIPSPFRHR